MSFRPRYERDIKSPSVSQEVRAWLREVFLEDWGLKLLALAITLGIWYGVTGQRAPATIRLRDIQIQFQLPDNLEISNEPRQEIDLTLTGSRRSLDGISVRDLIAMVDVTDFKAGERVVYLTESQIKIELPDGIRIVNIEPNAIPLTLETRVEREIPVEVRREGTPAEGFEIYGVSTNPPHIRVRGPASRIEQLQTAFTETIAVDGRAESFTVNQAAINIADSKITVLDPTVSVSVSVGEQRLEKNLADVEVRSHSGAGVRPERASITVYGPRSTIEQLNNENTALVLEEGENGGVTSRLATPEGLRNQVQLLSTRPAGFTLLK